MLLGDSRCARWPRKVRYRTERRAIDALARLVQAGMGQRRIYRCRECGGWHTTSQAVRRRTGQPTSLPAGFVSLITLPGHEPGVRHDHFAWRRRRAA